MLTHQHTAVGQQIRAFVALAENLSQGEMANRLEFLRNDMKT